MIELKVVLNEKDELVMNLCPVTQLDFPFSWMNVEINKLRIYRQIDVAVRESSPGRYGSYP